MAEGRIPRKGGKFSVEKAWDYLFFLASDREKTYKTGAVNSFEPCKLQFVLKSDIASSLFYKKIGNQHRLKILSSELVSVEVDSSELADIDRFWSSLIESVSQALQDKIVIKSLTLSSKDELENTLQNLDGCCQSLIHSGYVGVFYTNVKDSFVVKFVGTDITTGTVYENIKASAMKNKVRRERHCSHREIKAMVELGVVCELKEGFEDLVIQVDMETSVVSLQGTSMDHLGDCLKELSVLIGRIQFIALDFLSDAAQELVKNEKVRKYIREVLKDERIAFVTDNQDVYLVGMKIKNISALNMSVQNCFGEMKIDKDFLQSAQGKCFLEKQCDKIISKDYRGISYICFTLDLQEEVESLLSSFKKPCFRVVRDFLQLFGSNVLKSLVDKHQVEAEIKQNYVCFQGQYHNGQEAMNELERLVRISVVNFNHDESTVRLLSSRKQLDDISQCYKCSINVAKFSQGQHTLENNSTDGIEYLAKWSLHGSKGQISVTEVDFEKANLDGLIIPVNECMFGENIFGEEKLGERSYIEFCGSQGQKLELGQWRPLEFGSKYRGTNCVALVTSGIVIVDNKQSHCTIGSKLGESVRNIIYDLLSKGQWTILFAVPSNYPDFKSKLNDILSAYQDVVDEFDGEHESELVLCVKQSAEWWLQEVEYCLRWTVCTRRQVGFRYNGLFHKPYVNIEITRKSLLEVKADCLVVAVTPKLDLSKGHVSKLISEACGKNLQEELWSKHQHIKFWGEPIAVDSFNLSKKGLKKLIFTSLPAWKKKTEDQILENFVEDCLLLADSHSCSSVAFPVLGTGKLEFPVRDAVVALMNGIERYVSETTVGNISTVYIAVHDDITAEILDLEQKRRKDNSDMDVKQSQIEDQTYLIAEAGNVKCYIANETTFRAISSGRHVEVVFVPIPGENVKVQTDVKAPELIMVSCGNGKNDLKSAFKEVICFCEKERITSLDVHCHHNFTFPETDQVDDLLLVAEQTVYAFSSDDYPVRGHYKYLKHVTIVTSDFSYPAISSLKLVEVKQSITTRSLLQSLRSGFRTPSPTRTELKWDSACLKIPKTFINVILAGDKESDFKKAMEDVEKLCTTTNSSSDLAEFTDEVTAELNPGIVKYLNNLPKLDFNNWKQGLKIAYGVMLKEGESCNNLLVTGHFDDILKTEHYLENEFPSFPRAEDMTFEDQSQKYEDKQLVEFTVPFQGKDKLPILQLSANEQVKKYCVNDGGISIQCFQSGKEDVKSKVQQLISVQNQHKRTTPLNHDQVKVNTCLAQHQKTNKRYDPFLHKRANFMFRNIVVEICQADITVSEADCIVSPVNEVMNHCYGVAKAIARKAGSRYLNECKDVLKERRSIPLTDCVETGSGDLKSKYVLHVHTPVKMDLTRIQEQLLQIIDSVRHCLEKAEQLKATSIAFPFLCAGMSGFPADQCAQQYFRALKSFKPGEHLREVKFVDIKAQSVSRVCQTMTECNYMEDMNISQTYSELNLMGMDIFIMQGQLDAISCDAVAVSVDESFKGNDALEVILSLACQNFKIAYNDMKKQKHSCTSVVNFQADGELTCKSVLFAVTPVWKNDPDNYAKCIHITTQHILEKTCELQHSDLALPVLCNSGDPEVLACCCQAMAKSVLDFSKDKRNTIKRIHFQTEQEKAVSAMCHAMAFELKSVFGCAGSGEV